MNKLLTMSAAFALATTVTAGAASAATVIANGGTYQVGGAENQFIGQVSTTGGAGQWQVQFNSIQDPLAGTASATIGNIVAGEFTNLLLSWVSVATNNVLASKNIDPLETSLGTTFVSPDNLNQFLIISWTGAEKSDIPYGFDVEVSTVPLPAGLVLLLSGLMGLGFLGRSRAKAV